MLGALVVVAALLIVVTVLGYLERQRLTAAQAIERHTWAVERNELMTRIQAPELMRQVALPPPAQPIADPELRRALERLEGHAPELVDDGPEDESRLVGTVVGIGVE